MDRNREFSSVDIAIEGIRKCLFDSNIRAGQKLPSEAALCSQFGISRATVREALRALQTAGFVEYQPNRGFFARITNAHEESAIRTEDAIRWIVGNGSSLQEFFEARGILESAAARMAAVNANDHQLRSIRDALEALQNTTLAPKERSRIDSELHAAIVDASGNRHLCAFFRQLQPFFQQYSYNSYTLQNSLEITQEEHRRICQAIFSRCPEDAERAMLRHLNTAGRMMRFSEEKT